MPVNAKGRYVPPKKIKPEQPIPLYEQYGIDLRIRMPAWYPIMHFQAEVGKQVLKEGVNHDV